MINRNSEPIPERVIVGLDEYMDNMADRVRVEDMVDPDEVYLFYAPVAFSLSRVAIRAHASVKLEGLEADGMFARGTISFKDKDFFPTGPTDGFSGRFIGSFFAPDKSNPITVKSHFVTRSTTTGFLAREGGELEDELSEVMEHLAIERESELVR
jgi:hypothetical protein